MTDLIDLRRTLTDHEHLASDIPGLIESARLGAGRLRRRRRITSAAATLLAVMLVVLLAPAVIAHQRPAPKVPTAPTRAPFDLTIALAPNSGYISISYGVVGTTQYIVARGANNNATVAEDNLYFGTVEAHAPGTFDASALIKGTRITVQGHPAYLTDDLPIKTVDPANPVPPTAENPHGLPTTEVAIGWLDASGGWILVDGNREEAGVLQLANAVRYKAGMVVAPYRLTYLPPNLTGTYSETGTDADISRVGFGGQPAWTTGDGDVDPSLDGDLPLTILAWTIKGDYLGPPLPTAVPMKIGRYDAWYETVSNKEFNVTSSNLIVHANDCYVTIWVLNVQDVPLSEVTRMVKGAHFDTCSDVKTWTNPLP